MMYFTKLFRKYMPWNFSFAKNPTIHLGKWSPDTRLKTIQRKVDLANEDHCGPCGEYMLTKIPSASKNTNIDKKI